MKKLLEGILRKIEALETSYVRKDNQIIGPAGHSWYELRGIESKLIIEYLNEEKSPIIINFPGIILPDSIGHRVEVFQSDEGNIAKGYIIIDRSLNREYKATKGW